MAQTEAARQERLRNLSRIAVWLDITFPDTAPHSVACNLHYVRDSDRHIAEIGVQMSCTPAPNKDTKKARRTIAATWLHTLGYMVENTGHDIIPSSEIGRAGDFKSNHERLKVYEEMQKLHSAQESDDTTS